MKTLTLLALLALGAMAQMLPNTVYLPVIFYDYRADGSNPAFEQECVSSGIVPGMVDNRIQDPSMPKPSVNSIAPSAYSDRPQCYETVGQWFFPSGTGGPSTTATFYLDTVGGTTSSIPSAALGSRGVYFLRVKTAKTSRYLRLF